MSHSAITIADVFRLEAALGPVERAIVAGYFKLNQWPDEGEDWLPAESVYYAVRWAYVARLIVLSGPQGWTVNGVAQILMDTIGMDRRTARSLVERVASFNPDTEPSGGSGYSQDETIPSDLSSNP